MSRYGIQATSGQGEAVFSWSEELTAALPSEARKFEKDMHGGFNEDAETGNVYTGIPGAGLYRISPDLKTWTKIGGDKRLEDNIHGIVVFKEESTGLTQIAVAQNNAQRVLILNLDGSVKQELNTPRGGEFDCDDPNLYYSENRHKSGHFACTDVTYLNGRLYVVTGYSKGDYVLSAEMKDGQYNWGPIAWGGKGDAPGKFRTAHGVTAYDGHIYVSNREAFKVIKFTPEGKLVEILPDIPDGSRICNVARAEHDNYFVMNSLVPLGDGASGYGGHRTAPIYAHTGDHLIFCIDAGSLGIPVLKHIHNVWPHYHTNEAGVRNLYLLVHGWRDGKFAVLKKV